jgi:hypothetical protein
MSDSGWVFRGTMLPTLRLKPGSRAAGFADHVSATGNLTMPGEENRACGFERVAKGSFRKLPRKRTRACLYGEDDFASKRSGAGMKPNRPFHQESKRAPGGADILCYLASLGGFSFAESIAARNRGTVKSRKARTLSGSIPGPAWSMLRGIGSRSYCSRTMRNAPRATASV